MPPSMPPACCPHAAQERARGALGVAGKGPGGEFLEGGCGQAGPLLGGGDRDYDLHTGEGAQALDQNLFGFSSQLALPPGPTC